MSKNPAQLRVIPIVAILGVRMGFLALSSLAAIFWVDPRALLFLQALMPAIEALAAWGTTLFVLAQLKNLPKECSPKGILFRSMLLWSGCAMVLILAPTDPPPAYLGAAYLGMEVARLTTFLLGLGVVRTYLLAFGDTKSAKLTWLGIFGFPAVFGLNLLAFAVGNGELPLWVSSLTSGFELVSGIVCLNLLRQLGSMSRIESS